MVISAILVVLSDLYALQKLSNLDFPITQNQNQLLWLAAKFHDCISVACRAIQFTFRDVIFIMAYISSSEQNIFGSVAPIDWLFFYLQSYYLRWTFHSALQVTVLVELTERLQNTCWFANLKLLFFVLTSQHYTQWFRFVVGDCCWQSSFKQIISDRPTNKQESISAFYLFGHRGHPL